ncbi:MAG TPA: band 7 protein [Planctomycetaceae bacterium]|nr:band 7 protein [Planctomycetaceae bacterium]
MRRLIPVASVALLILVTVAVLGGLHWTINRIYVPVGMSLQLRYKGPLVFGERTPAETGFWAKEGEIGVLQKLRGPGRHFPCPIWWERTLVDDIVITPGHVGIVTCKLGASLPADEFLVPGDIGNTEFKGILRKALGPGRYRINPYGYEVTIVTTQEKREGTTVKHSGWVEIPTGFVGVVTNLTSIPNLKQGEMVAQEKGIQDDVLPPGIYPINGYEQQVDIVEIGYRETTIAVTKLRDADGKIVHDESGEPAVADDEEGIKFPSSDGFPIHMDFTAIWGLMPDQAAHAVRTFGNVAEVENKVVIPQIESICRNNGSTLKAIELLVGEQREQFQEMNLKEFREVLAEKNVTVEYGLVRHIYIPKEIREPIQAKNLATELAITREQEKLTANAEGELKEAEQQVDLSTETVVVETERLYEVKLAEGDREAKEIEALTEKLVAAIEKETANFRKQAQITIATAENEGLEMIEEATAEKFGLAVAAFGGAEAYINWVFATNLPDDLELKLIYAGEGTLWTDASNLGIRANLPIAPVSKPK